MMDGSPKRLKSAYRRFVESGIMDIDSAVITAKQRSRLCIGSDDSVERIESLYQELVDGRSQQEDIAFRRQRFRVDQDTVLSAVCEVFKVERAALYRRTRDSLLRSMAAKCLCQWSGCTQREVGEILKIGNGPSVSKRLKRLNTLLETDKHARRIQSAIERILALKEKGKV